MSPQDKQYYLERAEEEIRRARNAIHPKVLRAHYELARRYLDRAHGQGAGLQGRPPLIAT